LLGRGLVVGRDAGIAVFHALYFALDICNTRSPLFTGLSAMLQILAFMKQPRSTGGNRKPYKLFYILRFKGSISVIVGDR
jgi:hypothetical protein